MGTCKICGKTTEEGMDICKQCQEELDSVELNIDEFDISLDELELSQLTGELLETELEFNLTDPRNNLENPDIEIHDWPLTENEEKKDDLLSELSLEEEASIPDMLPNLDEVDFGEMAQLPDESISEDFDLSATLPDISGEDSDIDISQLLSGMEADNDIQFSELLPEMDANEMEADLSQALPQEDGEDDDLDDFFKADATEDGDIGVDGLFDGLLDTDGINVTGTEEADYPGGDASYDSDLAFHDLDADLNGSVDLLEELPDVKEMAEQKVQKPKVSIWKKLFGNVKDEKWEKQKAKEEQKELEKAKKLAEQEEKKAKQEELAEGEEATPKIDPKEAKKAEKLARKQEKQKLKEEKKAEKQRMKELAELEDADEGRINRVGAAIVFLFLGILAAGCIVGTNTYGYSNSVRQAKNYFDEDEYTAAYAKLNGLEIKENDEELFHKVQVVMYVNKQLNSYKNYTGIRMYPEALDSLLKGLRKYDKHIEEAKQLDVTEDFDKIRKEIIFELEDEYGLSEKEAYKLIDLASHEEYSKQVIRIANQ